MLCDSPRGRPCALRGHDSDDADLELPGFDGSRAPPASAGGGRGRLAAAALASMALAAVAAGGWRGELRSGVVRAGRRFLSRQGMGADPEGKGAEHLRQHFGVSEEEYKELFAAADEDADGKLKPPEAHKLVGSLMQRGNWTPPQFAKFDKDGSGFVDASEMSGAAAKVAKKFHVNATELKSLVASADADGDQQLNLEEFKTLLGSVASEGDGHPGGHGKKGKGKPWQGHGHGFGGERLEHMAQHLEERFGVSEEDYKQMFAEADNNSDGKLMPPEAQKLVGTMMQRGNWTPPQFGEFDKDADGQVSAEELDKAEHRAEKKFGVDAESFQSLVEAADLDGDQHLSPDEFKVLLGSLAMEGHPKPFGRWGGHHGEGHRKEDHHKGDHRAKGHADDAFVAVTEGTF